MSGIILILAQLAAMAGAFFALDWMARAGRSRRTLWIAALAVGAVVFIVLFKFSMPGFRFADFEKAYRPAALFILTDYDEFLDMLGPRGHGFVNLPILAYLWAPFVPFSQKVASHLWFVLGVAAMVQNWRMLVRLFALDDRKAAFLIIILCLSGPLIYGLKEGNTSHFVLLAFLYSVELLRGNRHFACGALLGFAALIKPPLLILGAYYLLRRAWRVVAGGAAMIVGMALLSILVLGWDTHVLWFERTIGPYGQLTLGTYNVQSVMSFFARLQGGIGALDNWDPAALAAGYKRAAQAILAAVAAIAIVSGVLARRSAAPPEPWGGRADLIELSMALIVAAVASPLSWSHYFTWLFPAMALLLGIAELSRRESLLLWAAIFLAAPLALLIQPSAQPLAGLVLLGASAPLYAAFVLLGLLVWRRLKGVHVPVLGFRP